MALSSSSGGTCHRTSPASPSDRRLVVRIRFLQAARVTPPDVVSVMEHVPSTATIIHGRADSAGVRDLCQEA
ncbi:hypothetical protein [Nonomuraea gerenzanensis]|uniref:Uncharacterized protein n=1 Tax=Nonomuraea gerenzanensis TaxID=93944 RepID=A0A1M4EMK0_9ACTN|nr:hypothetical protein [Nonomuraea gerenzanensis]UBU11573.1 hypothetical protein LCN96_45920 [Nonomuraea gerenzanensis]SBP00070.1 hypothetical protein BN4615_P9586 [Nonomuraea gerenzanensis]